MHRIRYQVKSNTGDILGCEVTMNLPTEWAYGESIPLRDVAADRLFSRKLHRGEKLLPRVSGDFFMQGEAACLILVESVEEA